MRPVLRAMMHPVLHRAGRAAPTLGAALAPLPAVAGVCDTLAPDWDPAGGPVGEAGHLLLLAQTSGGVLVIGACCAALLIPRALPALLAANLNLLAAIALWLDASDPAGAARQAVAEGCARPPGFAILALIFTAAGLFVLGGMRLKRRIAVQLAVARALDAQAKTREGGRPDGDGHPPGA